MTTPSTDEYLQHAFSILSPLASSELCSHRSYSSSISHHVRTQDVLAHLSAQSIPIEWRPITPNISTVAFATEDWNSWEQYFLAASSANGTEASDHLINQEINSDSVTCYGSESWDRDYMLAGLIGSACATLYFGLNVGKCIIADLKQATANSN